MTLSQFIRAWSWACWIALAMWALGLVSPWVPHGMGALGIALVVVRKRRRRQGVRL